MLSRSPLRSLTPLTRSRYLQTRHKSSLVLSDAQRSTIYALGTPPGKAGVAVVRVSGPDALETWRGMVKGSGGHETTPQPWKLKRCRIVHPQNGETIDDGLAVFFKGPKSFTAEDTVELHLHSGPAVIAAALAALSTFPTCRPAAPGEFTRRAFLNGRMDLTQVEGLKDLIDAGTESQRKIALRAAEGAIREKFDELRQRIISALAKVEALIDFGEGEEIEEGVYEDARSQVTEVVDIIKGYLNDHRRGELLRSGIRLAIFGPPNAGKSSLLNILARREAAIVTPIPGTTRDILELALDIGGLPVIVADTAGLRKTDDTVEQIGIERARKAVANSDVSICVLSLPDLQNLTEDGNNWKELITPNTYFLLNKADLMPAQWRPDSAVLRELGVVQERMWVSSLAKRDGFEVFLSGFASALQKQFGMSDDLTEATQSPIITRQRHRENLENATRFLESALAYGPDDIVFAAEELRYAANAIGKVTGAIGVEDVLDAVFRDFCIGK
ncbi:tRNA modification GTPase GTPBP3 [Coprinopsis cinerea okayama7|uniref:tRNA modification GTPase GTPBP3 n=1 Tax=Coprinopsis cinerea (strain Okayama-7 / 130 / ATCC MYA-4618 / FGSC 9003) TaxID=240176 RepID=A8NEA9_COPC7|nr:tRNA modification GTPase GTPBP3 [Coprinopsis cinerea okayama7\|eukprot:XP_001832975.2 tRNA modification GTPase GTPBP3 [Coprinopsis cinerea okayama7\